MRKLSAIWMFFLISAFMPGTAFPQTQYLINGVNPFPLTLETAPPNDCATVTIEVDPGGIINTPLITAGCWIIWDNSQVSVANVVAADDVGGGPWDSGFTYEVPDADGPGTYMLAVGQFGTVSINDGPIPICDIEFCCEEPGQSQITISTIPGFETIVGDTSVWDPQVANGLIDLTQITTPCRCAIVGPAVIEGDAFGTVTAQYDVSSNQQCTNPSEYVWSDTCIKGDVDQNGLMTVPPSDYWEVCEICVTDTANTDINTGELVQYCLFIEITGYPPDTDGDGYFDLEDNCPTIPNGYWEGTCKSGTVGEICNDHEDCGTEGYCSMYQEDTDEDGLGDVCDNCPNNYNPTQEDNYPPPPNGNGIADGCDCEGDFDCDGDCDGTDAAFFKTDFGRSGFNDPCESGDRCNGDFDCDEDVDGTDAALFKDDFGRSSFTNPCPICLQGVEWCVYAEIPFVGSYSNSGCLGSFMEVEGEYGCGDDEIVAEVTANVIHLKHFNAFYNCCLDDIAITMTVEENLLQLRETEINVGCRCMCCYTVESDIGGVEAGEYTIEYCWNYPGTPVCEILFVTVPQ